MESIPNKLNNKSVVLLFALYSIFFCSVSQAVDFGGIKGQVNYCEQGGLDGMLIYVPGRQYNVITDSSGRFEFEFMPVGPYIIYYRYNGVTLQTNTGVLVNDDAISDLGKIALCDSEVKSQSSRISMPADSIKSSNEKIDKDNDGVPMARDCNDNDASIRPGAIDICDGKDNNCNGLVDENSVYIIQNGIGTCLGGIIKVDQCSGGYADCDADAANGCEINLNSDSENCGSCSNACSSMDECAQGLC